MGTPREIMQELKALDVVLQNQVLTDEVLLTAFAELEWLVNSRPLTEVSSDVDDLEALTPNHTIIGRGTVNLPPGFLVDREIFFIFFLFIYFFCCLYFFY